MKEVKMMMSFDDTDPAGTLLVARFSADEIALLGEYRRNSARLRETRIIRDGLPSSVIYKWTNVAGTVAETEDGEVDFELIGSFLHHLRPLFLSEEPASFEKIAGLIGRRFSHRLMKRHLKAIRSIAENSPFHAYGQITIGDVPLWDYKTLKKWLNAFEYHHDPEKKEYLSGVEANLGPTGVRAVFVQQLYHQSSAYLELENLVNFIIEF